MQSCVEAPFQDNYPLRSISAGKLKATPPQTKSFKKTIFPQCIDEWNKLKPKVRNAQSIYKLKKSITIKQENSLYNVHDHVGVKFLSRLRLQFTHLNEHKFKHGVNGRVNPVCPCGAEVKTAEHFLLRCQCFSTRRIELFNNLYNVDSSFSKLNTKDKVAYLLHGSTNNSNDLNKDITEHVMKFLKSTYRFNK